MAELQAHEATARLQHSERLGQHAIDVRAIAYAKGDRVRGERAVRKGQLFGVGAHPVDGDAGILVRIGVAQVVGTAFAHVQHVLIDVADGDMAFGWRFLCTSATSRRQVIEIVYVSECNVTYV